MLNSMQAGPGIIVAVARPTGAIGGTEIANSVNEQRGLALILFHALRSAIEKLEPDANPNDRELRSMVLDALNLLPQLDAQSTAQSSWITLRRLSATSRSEPLRLNIQDTIDSLRIVWRDYCRFTHK